MGGMQSALEEILHLQRANLGGMAEPPPPRFNNNDGTYFDLGERKAANLDVLS